MLSHAAAWCWLVGPALAGWGPTQSVLDSSMQVVMIWVLVAVVGVFGYLIVVRIVTIDRDAGPSPGTAPGKTDGDDLRLDHSPDWNAEGEQTDGENPADDD